jgi:hypothetical protein
MVQVNRRGAGLGAVLIGVLSCSSLVVASAALDGHWLPGTRWELSIDDGPAKPRQVVTLKVTTEKANSCLGGDWQRLQRVQGYYDNLSEPAYRIEGEHLTILLASDVCDRYDRLEGTLRDGRFSARHSLFGIGGSDDLGTAEGVQVR